MARLVGRWPLIVAAAPYLETHGVQSSGGVGRSCIRHRGAGGRQELLFHQGNRQVKVHPKGQVSINGAEVAVSAVRAGLGIAVASLPSFSEDLDTGALVQLLPDWKLNDIEARAC